ncbi:uncharacterized protein EDB91DRAFT_1084157 [Suillus paluster]|uniref:uncharacterized protein n=1 Tax=Suillus paluster TaxID=48578 RepID=UPI001B8741A9|nr:uncharacterized protein EDB91DRAFT_1084157 [Suillus paluster]KAG1734253.1 hypothetical protein EDB91DRAFT_1084157 [Suillus paluster]
MDYPMSVNVTNTRCPPIGPEDAQTSHDSKLFDDDNGCESATANLWPVEHDFQLVQYDLWPVEHVFQLVRYDFWPVQFDLTRGSEMNRHLKNNTFMKLTIHKNFVQLYINKKNRLTKSWRKDRWCTSKLKNASGNKNIMQKWCASKLRNTFRNNTVLQKCYWQVRQQAEEHIQEQYLLAEDEHKCHARDIGKQAQQLEAALREWEKQLKYAENELEVIHKQHHQQCQEAELTERRQKELEEHEKSIGAEVEQRLQLEVENLKAEKQAELTNMEQQFARCGRQQDAAMDMDTDTTPRSAQQQAKTPQKPQSNTPSLDAIKRIKKAHGTMRRTCLVSVADDNDPIEMCPEQSHMVKPEPLQSGDASMSAMENAVSRGVEAALKHILIDKDLLRVMKRSPQRKDADCLGHKTATRDVVNSYEYENGPGPDHQELAFDLANGSKTPWNVRILNMLLEDLERSKKDDWLVQKLKKDEVEEDLPTWQWLQKLIKMVGDNGMSSEESDMENNVKTVLWVKNMPWHCGVEKELNIINHQRVLEVEIFLPQGSKPMKRICVPSNLETSWSPMTGLPKGQYDGEWISDLTEREVQRLEMSNETFR